jgi:hypothetical protein
MNTQAARRSSASVFGKIPSTSAALDLAVEPLERVGRPDVAPVRVREVGERGQVGLGLAQQLGDGRELPREGVADDFDVLADGVAGGLGEDRVDQLHAAGPAGEPAVAQ